MDTKSSLHKKRYAYSASTNSLSSATSSLAFSVSLSHALLMARCTSEPTEAGSDLWGEKEIAVGFIRSGVRYASMIQKYVKRSQVKIITHWRGRSHLDNLKRKLSAFLKFPIRFRPRTWSRSAEQLRSAIELKESYSEIKKEGNLKRPISRHAPQKIVSVDMSQGLWRQAVGEGLLAFPGFVCSVALTTFIFSFYEHSMRNLNSFNTTVGINELHIPLLLGCVGGCGHGVLHSVVHNLLHKSRYATGHRYCLLPTAFSHSIGYGSLFGSYEAVKSILFKSVEVEDRLNFSATLCIATAGAFSGIISEAVLHFTKSMEHCELKTGFTRLKHLPLPTIRNCIPGILMSTFGKIFLPLQ